MKALQCQFRWTGADGREHRCTLPPHQDADHWDIGPARPQQATRWSA